MSHTVPTPAIHSFRRITFARLAATFGVLTLLLGLVACGDKTDDANGTGMTASRSITHALGTAEIEGTPERVVTLGQGSAETALALGVIPVAMEVYEWGADDSGYLPWINEDLEKKGVKDGEKPELIPGSEELSAEKIASLEPDLILAPWSGLTQGQYDQLSKIAPTVAYEKEPWVITWEEQINTVAKALGKEDQAQGLIDTINKEFEEAKQDSYEDHTFSFIYNTGVGNYGIFLPTEQRVEFVSKLGLKIDPVIEEFRDDVVVGTDSASISAENLSKLNNSDLIFTFYMNDEVRKELHENLVYSKISAISKGAEVAPTDQSFVTGSSMINPLTVPWAIERYKKQIDEALAKADK